MPPVSKIDTALMTLRKVGTIIGTLKWNLIIKFAKIVLIYENYERKLKIMTFIKIYDKIPKIMKIYEFMMSQ